MVINLPNVFTHKRIGVSDWKLYDACKVKQSDILLSKAEAAFSGKISISITDIHSLISNFYISIIDIQTDNNPKRFSTISFMNITECKLLLTFSLNFCN